MRVLDISESVNVRMECLYSVENLDLITNWSRHTVESVRQFAEGRTIRLTTLNPGFK